MKNIKRGSYGVVDSVQGNKHSIFAIASRDIYESKPDPKSGSDPDFFNVNVKAAVGIGENFRPGAEIQATISKALGKTALSNGKEIEFKGDAEVTGTLLLGKGLATHASAAITATHADTDGSSTILQAGIGASTSFGSRPDVVAALRLDHKTGTTNTLSPYFKVSASIGGSERGNKELEVGACITPEIKDVPIPSSTSVCVGAYHQTNGKDGVRFSIGTSF